MSERADDGASPLVHPEAAEVVMVLRTLPSRRPRAVSALLVLVLSSACASTMRQVRLTTEVPEEFWLPDAARDYLQTQGFTVWVLESTSSRIWISGTKELGDIRNVVFVTLKTQYYTGIHDAADQTHEFQAEIRVLRYLRDAGGGWSPTDPEPLRGLAEELADVVKTGAMRRS